MVWKVDFSPTAAKQFDKLDRLVQKSIRAFVKEIEAGDNPRHLMAPYTGLLAGSWKSALVIIESFAGYMGRC